HQLMPHNIALVKIRESETLDVLEHINCFQQATSASVGQIDLRNVPRDHCLGVKSQARHKHFHLLGSSVLRLVQNDKRIIQSTAAHESDGRDLNDIFFQITVHSLRIKHVVESIIKRAQIWIDFFLQCPRQKAQTFSSFHCRTCQNDPIHTLRN